MDYMGKLAKYPGLANWYMNESSKHRSNEVGPQQFVIRICESLCLAPKNSALSFADSMDRFFNSSKSPLNDYLHAEEIVNSCEETLLEIISRFGEDAVRDGTAGRFLNAVSNAADKTGIVGLRFLSAWICLNCGDLTRCIEECEKVDEPFASIYTILGQALLELKRIPQAIEALTIAVKLSPAELLAWFQLAKAQYATGKYRDAFASLCECEKHSPNNAEISLFQSIVANEVDDTGIQLAAYRGLKPHLKKNAGDAEVVFNLLYLAVKLDDKIKVESCLNDIDFERLKSDHRFAKMVSPLLRGLYEKNWMALSALFLTGMTESA